MKLSALLKQHADAEAALAAAKLRSAMAKSAIENDEFLARRVACEEVTKAVLLTVCRSQSSAIVSEALDIALQGCDDEVQRYWREFVLTEAVERRKPPRRGLPSLLWFEGADE